MSVGSNRLWKILLGILLVAAAILLLMTDSFRFAKTLFLIARIAPYEQSGSGAGTVLVLGDSTGYGTGASNKKYSVAGRLGADYPEYTIKNRSVNGRTIGELLHDTREFSGQYDLIVLQIGANDILQERDTTAVLADLQQLIDRLLPHSQSIVMLTSGNIGAAQAFSGAQAQQYDALTRAYRAKVIELAQNTEHFTYVDLFDEPADDPFAQQPKKYTSIDGLHPSNEGYELWYMRAKSSFAQALKKKDSDSGMESL